jgi:hypothetical protein
MSLQTSDSIWSPRRLLGHSPRSLRVAEALEGLPALSRALDEGQARRILTRPAAPLR